jgi:suppressor for copper-sensitivity B
VFRGLVGIFLVIWGLLAPSGSVFAAAGPWWSTDHGAVRLIAESNAVGSATKLRLGLHFKMKPGWKIYWRSPGDAGFPPRPSWKGSQNLADIKVDWPAPTRFSVLGLETLGYKKEVVLPLTVQLFEPGKAVNIKATVPYLTCEEICVPYEAKLTLVLPAGSESSSAEGYLINKYVSAVPKKVTGTAGKISSVSVIGPAGKQTLQVAAAVSGKSDLLIEGPRGFRFSKAKFVTRDDDGKAVFAALVSPPIKSVKAGKPLDLAGKDIVLTLLGDANGAVEVKTQPSAGVVIQTAPPLSIGAFLSILALAVLGGLILNLMPCVLPVLSLKMLSVIGHGGEDPKVVRKGFLASAAGILVSFLILGSAAVILKATGQATGWGIQFQQPIFLTAMAVVVALFAANLWGMFEIRLPSFLSDRAATASQGQGMAGHFATGAFAALLATPCSAPFLGTAVGFALARGAFEIYVIFTALGLGLALPYLLVAAFPALANRFPKPGQWMVTLRKILAFALVATAAWLLTVLDTQIGRPAALVTVGLLVALVAVIAFYHRASEQRRKFVMSGAVIVGLSAILVPPQLGQQDAKSATVSAGYWREFDPAAIPGHVAAGKTVFVDVTADWCVTCKVNKELVLDTDAIDKQLKQKNVVAMRADWTRPDPQITSFLQRFMRYGIPFNVVFGPKAPQGIVLPELLRRDSVISALNGAQKGRALAKK